MSYKMWKKVHLYFKVKTFSDTQGRQNLLLIYLSVFYLKYFLLVRMILYSEFLKISTCPYRLWDNLGNMDNWFCRPWYQIQNAVKCHLAFICSLHIWFKIQRNTLVVCEIKKTLFQLPGSKCCCFLETYVYWEVSTEI